MKAWEVAIDMWRRDGNTGLGIPFLTLIESRSRGVKPSKTLARTIIREMREEERRKAFAWVWVQMCLTTDMPVFCFDDFYEDEREHDNSWGESYRREENGFLCTEEDEEFLKSDFLINRYEVDWNSEELSRIGTDYGDYEWGRPTENDERFIARVLKKVR